MKYSKKTMMAILEFIVVCLAIFFVFKGIIMPVKVDGSSMYPTLHDGDLAFMSRLDLNSKQIKRFDIVTIDCKQLDNVIIKRVIGLPGEKIVYKNDCLYVNGKYIKENYLNKSHIKDVNTSIIACSTSSSLQPTKLRQAVNNVKIKYTYFLVIIFFLLIVSY